MHCIVLAEWGLIAGVIAAVVVMIIEAIVIALCSVACCWRRKVSQFNVDSAINSDEKVLTTSVNDSYSGVCVSNRGGYSENVYINSNVDEEMTGW